MNESITQAELAAALYRRNWAADTTARVADEIFRDVIALREPEWSVGDVVRDEEGTFWRREANDKWLTFGNNYLFRHNGPRRPLTRVVT